MNKILVLGLMLMFVLLSAQAADTEQGEEGDQTTVAAAATSTVSLVKMKKVKPEEDNFDINVLNTIVSTSLKDGQDDFTYWLTPGIAYKIKDPNVTVGADLWMVMPLKRNGSYDSGQRPDIDYLAIYGKAPVWKNKAGTTLDSYVEIDTESVSTLDSRMTADNKSQYIYGSMTLNQTVGRADVFVRPNLLYEVNPIYTAGDADNGLQYRPAVDVNLQYKLTKHFDVYYLSKFRRYVRSAGASENVFLGYPGVTYTNRRLTVNGYLIVKNRPLDRDRADMYLEIAYVF